MKSNAIGSPILAHASGIGKPSFARVAGANQALEQTRDCVLRFGERIGRELLNLVVRPLSMKSFNSVLAVVCGFVVFGTAATFGRWALQFRNMYAEFDMELSAYASAIVNAPFVAYLGVGFLLGLAVALLIWVIKPRWLSLPIDPLPKS